ncbi:LacI family DNA-binding transcriptional regulator [Mycobacterium sp. MS1601]|uniref:LacI family DNA-binding transcriptional regulator n=1 Tax=Mycobacterium sp. MS1601 TaxID=1936029 RepID=UPI0009FADB98|nr:LacI family DNA-binding transcriptional regulator [Mycobacterium sp. MS1601]
MRPRLEDVAKLANVHPATVSRALNERTRDLVSAETLDRVIRAADELNYLPNTMARSLASARSSTIGVVVGDLAVPLFAHMVRGIDDVTNAAAYTALIVNTDNDPERELRHLRSLEERRVDGLIVTTSTLNDPDSCRRFSQVAPVVNLLRTSGDPSVGQVISNDALGMKLIMDHLFELGHRRIGLVAGPQHISTARARLRGYRDALLDREIQLDQSLVATIDHIDTEWGRRATAQFLDSTDATAIVGFNDLTTFGVLQQLRAQGVDCPREISVVGFSDVPAAELVSPALTTVAVDHYRMGVEAARMMLSLLDTPDTYVPDR